MGFWIMMIVCILVLDMYDLCALSADSAHVRRWSLPGSINRFVTLVMITLRMDALLDGCDHRLGPIRCYFFILWSRPSQSWQRSHRDSRILLDDMPSGASLRRSRQWDDLLPNYLNTCCTSNAASEMREEHPMLPSQDAQTFATPVPHMPFLALAGTLTHPIRLHPRSHQKCLQVGYCRMFLSGLHAIPRQLPSLAGMARRQACAIKRQTMACRWWRMLGFLCSKERSPQL